ncbi:MAG: hypothetical protein IIC10_02520 [Proteobacteria bacterium]|nr:hypothetical protein [Pseudomonadota bacterium]
MSNCSNKIRVLICLSLLSLLALPSQAQEDLSANFDGVWTADGTLFTIGIAVEDGVLKITQMESLGFEWTNADGKLEGNVATIEVDYISAGVTGIIQVELVDANTAIAFAATCTPDFMVACLLAKGRQAVFRRVETP